MTLENAGQRVGRGEAEAAAGGKLSPNLLPSCGGQLEDRKNKE